MSATVYSRWTMSRFGGGPIIRGVCADVAERAGLPVWMPRVAFLVFGLLHWLLAIMFYLLLAKVMSPGSRRMKPGLPPLGPARYAPMQPDIGGVRNRFGALDARLADLEAATLQQEAALRRQFRDMERG